MAKSSKSERAENPETPDRQSVINLVNGTAETPNERLVKKHLPAWVISGGLHVVLALGALGLTILFPKANANPSRDETPVTVDERKDEPEQKDLTKDTQGLDSTIETSVDSTVEKEVNVETKINTVKLFPTSKLVSKITGMQVQRNKAIVGQNAFAHEAGIHQHGMLQDRSTYEIMRPQDVGFTGTTLVLGKHSGRHAFRDRITSLGYHLDDAAFEQFR